MSEVLPLQLTDVSKSYGAVMALKKVSFQIKASEFVGLLGQNGAGKSTLFQLLTGLFTADSGQIKVCGLDIRMAPIQVLAHIGVVFQQPTLDLGLTVSDNLQFHCLLHGIRRKEAAMRIHEELQRFDLAGVSSNPVRSLSGGNRRKIELVRALLTRPRLLLMDEATVGLDPVSRASLLRHVMKLCHERGMAVLWCTHLIDEVTHADRVILLEKGNVLADSVPADLELPESDMTAPISKVFAALASHSP